MSEQDYREETPETERKKAETGEVEDTKKEDEYENYFRSKEFMQNIYFK